MANSNTTKAFHRLMRVPPNRWSLRFDNAFDCFKASSHQLIMTQTSHSCRFISFISCLYVLGLGTNIQPRNFGKKIVIVTMTGVLALHCRQTCLDKEASIQRHTVTSPLHHTNVRISGTVAIHHVVNNLVFVAECENASKLDQMQWKMSLEACPCRQLAAYTIEI